MSSVELPLTSPTRTMKLYSWVLNYGPSLFSRSLLRFHVSPQKRVERSLPALRQRRWEWISKAKQLRSWLINHLCLCSGNGYIPTSSLREILAALDDQLTSDQLNGKMSCGWMEFHFPKPFFFSLPSTEMIAEIDTDSSGTVDFDGECSRFIFIRQFASQWTPGQLVFFPLGQEHRAEQAEKLSFCRRSSSRRDNENLIETKLSSGIIYYLRVRLCASPKFKLVSFVDIFTWVWYRER